MRYAEPPTAAPASRPTSDPTRVDAAPGAARVEVAPDPAAPDILNDVPVRGSRVFYVVYGVLVAWALTVLAQVWAMFGSFDPHVGRLPPEEHPWYFPVIMFHVVTTTVSLLTVLLQLWPWLRHHYPKVHRAVGRVYVFAGALPTAVTGIVLTLVWPASPLISFRDVLAGLAWLGATIFGLVLARQGRFVDHRHWMLRSYAIAGSSLLSPILDYPIQLILAPLVDSKFAGSADVLEQAENSTRLWLTLTLALIAVEWWIGRDQRRQSKAAARAVRRPVRLTRRAPDRLAA